MLPPTNTPLKKKVQLRIVARLASLSCVVPRVFFPLKAGTNLKVGPAEVVILPEADKHLTLGCPFPDARTPDGDLDLLRVPKRAVWGFQRRHATTASGPKWLN